MVNKILQDLYISLRDLSSFLGRLDNQECRLRLPFLLFSFLAKPS